MKWGRVLAAVVILAGLLFGIFQGEYSTLDWWTLRRQVREEREALERLAREIDSLAAYADSIETDSATQERVAREKFGMMRDGEMLFRLEPVER